MIYLKQFTWTGNGGVMLAKLEVTTTPNRLGMLIMRGNPGEIIKDLKHNGFETQVFPENGKSKVLVYDGSRHFSAEELARIVGKHMPEEAIMTISHVWQKDRSEVAVVQFSGEEQLRLTVSRHFLPDIQGKVEGLVERGYLSPLPPHVMGDLRSYCILKPTFSASGDWKADFINIVSFWLQLAQDQV